MTNRQRLIAPRTTSGSPAEAGVVGVTQTTPHPPGQPLPAGGQVRDPPVGQGGGVQTMVGVAQMTPHPPGHPFPSGGHVNVPEEQGGGVQTIVTDRVGERTATAAAGAPAITRMTSRRAAVNLFSIPFILYDFIKKMWLQFDRSSGIFPNRPAHPVCWRNERISWMSGTEWTG